MKRPEELWWIRYLFTSHPTVMVIIPRLCSWAQSHLVRTWTSFRILNLACQEHKVSFSSSYNPSLCHGIHALLCYYTLPSCLCPVCRISSTPNTSCQATSAPVCHCDTLTRGRYQVHRRKIPELGSISDHEAAHTRCIGGKLSEATSHARISRWSWHQEYNTTPTTRP